jgi:hypothetical protein
MVKWLTAVGPTSLGNIPEATSGEKDGLAERGYNGVS